MAANPLEAVQIVNTNPSVRKAVSVTDVGHSIMHQTHFHLPEASLAMRPRRPSNK